MYIYTDANQDGQLRCARFENGVFHSVPHVHRDIELVYVQEGRVGVMIDGCSFAAEEESCLMILPHQIHFYDSSASACGMVLNFPGEMVSSFSAIVGTSVAVDPVFAPDEVSKILLGRFLQALPGEVCDQKCLLYALCSCFLKKARFTQPRLPDRSPAYHAIRYVSEHYQENITLKDIARELGYDYHYLSRAFTQTTHTGFRDFLNSHRIECARGLLRNTNLPVSSIAVKCGFQTLRSFHRAFQDLLGLSPTQYRNAKDI